MRGCGTLIITAFVLAIMSCSRREEVTVPHRAMEPAPKQELAASASLFGEMKASLGVSFQEIDPLTAAAHGLTNGVLILDVSPEGPASTILQVGDVLLSWNGHAIVDGDDALSLVDAASPGDTVKLRFLRGSEQHEIEIVMGVASGNGQPLPDFEATREINQLFQDFDREFLLLRKQLRETEEGPTASPAIPSPGQVPGK